MGNEPFTVPMDGTFWQDRPIHRLAPFSPQYDASFDLSSAIDRWPVSIIHDLVACMLGPSLASCIVNGCLALNACYVGNRTTKVKGKICFLAGRSAIGQLW